jgi:tetratricopeptide (TPR) repeat protein
MRFLALSLLLLALLAGCDRAARLMNSGNQAYHQGDLEAAARYYRQAEQIPSMTAAARYNLSRVVAAQGRSEQALRYLDEVLAAEPYNADARLDRAELYLAQGQHRAAESDLSAILRVAPDRAEAWLDLARLRQRQKSFGEAARAATRASGDPSLRGAALLVRGQCRQAGNDMPGATADYEAAEKASPFLSEIYFSQASLYRAIGDPREAVRRLRKGLSIEPDNRQALAELRRLESR